MLVVWCTWTLLRVQCYHSYSNHLRSGRLLDLSGYGDCRTRFQSEVQVLFLSLLQLRIPALYAMLIAVTMNSGPLAHVRWGWLGYVLEM